MNKAKRNIIIENLGSALLLTLTGSIILAPQVPMLRTVSEYSVHVMLGMFVASIVLMLLDKKQMMFSALACTAALCLFLKDASNSNLKLPVVNEEVKLSVAHVNLSNIVDDLTDIAAIAQGESVDVICFQELTPDWQPLLQEKLATLYPYYFENVRIDPYGMAIYSRHQLLATDTILCDGIPTMSVELTKADQLFHLVSSYLTPALDKQSLSMASQQLQRITREIESLPGHVIALGEYNMVYWTKEIKDFTSTTELKNSRRDIAQGNLRVPYDHIFFSKDLECVEFNEMLGREQEYLGIRGIYQIKEVVLSQVKELR